MVYVVALDGVPGHEVGNVSRAVKGALGACNLSHRENNMTFRIDPGWGILGGAIYGQIKLNIQTVVVTTWELYKEVVEDRRQAVIVNAHGETLPIPTGYSRNGWIDKIAEAMLNREIAWVHTAGYPFNFSWGKETGEFLSGRENFKRLMGHIGRPDLTCDPPYYKEQRWSLSLDGGSAIGGHNWVEIQNAYFVELGNPLQASDFDRYTIFPIWGAKYHPGAIVKFASSNATATFGFYIHVGTYRTFTSSLEPTDSDYYRSYVGTGAAIYIVAAKTAALDTISNAEETISKAKDEKRTKGLADAEDLLDKAWEHFYKLNYIGRTSAIICADEAIQAAEIATTSNPVNVRSLLILLGIMGIAVIGSIVIRIRENSKKRSENQ